MDWASVKAFFNTSLDKTGVWMRGIKSGAFTPRELREYPNIRRLVLKGAAVLAFLLVVGLCVGIFLHSVHSMNKKNEQFCEDAGKVCTDYIAQYGACKFESFAVKGGKKLARMTGIAYARRMDFNHDGKDELMACYQDGSQYYLEVWGYDGKDFVKFYSQEANRAQSDTELGSWLTFYQKGNKYYIGRSEPDKPENVTLYALRGKEFKKSGTCTYSTSTGMYSVRGEVNAVDFERIQLSYIRPARAEILVDTVTQNMEEFEAKTTAQIEAGKTDVQLKAQAFYDIVDRYNTKYGSARFVKDGSSVYIDGLAVADLVDFDGDGNEELFLIYRKELIKRNKNTYNNAFVAVKEPVYCMEVYSWNGSVAKCIFDRTGISEKLQDDTGENFYVFRKSGKKTDICNNAYSYPSRSQYTASSRIYRLKNEKFESVFDARLEYQYGYKTYYLDGEKTYRSTFETKGYEVPYFCNDDGYNTDIFTVTYLSGGQKRADDLKTRITKTTQSIRSLNRDYMPAEDE